MAYSDLGVLLPTESQYGNPQAYTEEIRAEANKQATYLSNMDQFYAQLEESKRQFDLNYEARSKEFDWTSGFEEKRLAHQTTIYTRKLELQEKESELLRQIKEKELQFAETQLGFERERIGFEREKLQGELDMMRQQIGLREREMGLQEKLGFATLEQQQRGLDVESQYKMGSLNLQSQQNAQQYSLQSAQLSFDQAIARAQFSAGLDQAFPQGVTSKQTGGLGTYASKAYNYGKTPATQSASSYYSNLLPTTKTQAQPTYQTYTPNYSTMNTAQAYMAKWS